MGEGGYWFYRRSSFRGEKKVPLEFDQISSSDIGGDHSRHTVPNGIGVGQQRALNDVAIL